MSAQPVRSNVHDGHQELRRIIEVTERGEQDTVGVLPLLRELFGDHGLRRGTAIAVRGSVSLLLALMAGASRNGGWCAAVGMPWLGIAAAAEIGVALERLALVPSVGANQAMVLAALIDGMDMVAFAGTTRLHDADTRRLLARARQHGAVLVGLGEWSAAELRLSIVESSWRGIGQGYGRLRARLVTIQLDGRGRAARPRRIQLWLPGPNGVPQAVDEANDHKWLNPYSPPEDPASPFPDHRRALQAVDFTDNPHRLGDGGPGEGRSGGGLFAGDGSPIPGTNTPSEGPAVHGGGMNDNDSIDSVKAV